MDQSAPVGGGDDLEVKGLVDEPAVSPLPFDAVAAFSPPEPADVSDSDPSFVEASFDRAALRRSFFAQPEPLKWMAGAANALRTGPEPHNGQLAGGSASTPWIASKRRPHAEQS
jgi:hypothetical protein